MQWFIVFAPPSSSQQKQSPVVGFHDALHVPTVPYNVSRHMAISQATKYGPEFVFWKFIAIIYSYWSSSVNLFSGFGSYDLNKCHCLCSCECIYRHIYYYRHYYYRHTNSLQIVISLFTTIYLRSTLQCGWPKPWQHLFKTMFVRNKPLFG